MAMGRARPKDAVFALAPHGFVLLHPRPSPHDVEIFLPHPCPFGPCKAPPHPIKLYFLMIYPQLLQFFFNKTCFINKNILEIINKFIPSNQTKF